MNNKEAIRVLKSTSINFSRMGGKTAYVEALEMAITALELSDSISQQLDSKEFHKDIPTCDRNICFQNDANGIECEDCEVTKAQQLNNSNEQLNNSTNNSTNEIKWIEFMPWKPFEMKCPYGKGEHEWTH